MNEQEVRYLVNDLNEKLCGCKFHGAIVAQDPDHDVCEFWPTLVFEDSKGNVLLSTIMQDPEGNGAGWMDAGVATPESALTPSDIARLINGT